MVRVCYRGHFITLRRCLLATEAIYKNIFCILFTHEQFLWVISFLDCLFLDSLPNISIFMTCCHTDMPMRQTCCHTNSKVAKKVSHRLPPHAKLLITHRPTPSVGAACVEIFTVRHTSKPHEVIVCTVSNKFPSQVSP